MYTLLLHTIFHYYLHILENIKVTKQQTSLSFKDNYMPRNGKTLHSQLSNFGKSALLLNQSLVDIAHKGRPYNFVADAMQMVVSKGTTFTWSQKVYANSDDTLAREDVHLSAGVRAVTFWGPTQPS